MEYLVILKPRRLARDIVPRSFQNFLQFNRRRSGTQGCNLPVADGCVNNTLTTTAHFQRERIHTCTRILARIIHLHSHIHGVALHALSCHSRHEHPRHRRRADLFSMSNLRTSRSRSLCGNIAERNEPLSQQIDGKKKQARTKQLRQSRKWTRKPTK